MRIAALVALTTLGLAATVRADYEETERRLKEAGVDESLRERIHRAIDRGVEYLLDHQRENGTFGFGYGAAWAPSAQLTPLCALALRHAGTPRARAGARKALTWLFPPKSVGRSFLYEEVYNAGIVLMLLAADRSHREEAAAIARQLARGLHAGSGTWGYRTALGLDRGDLPDRPNLSTAQFAALGLWAAGRLGAETDPRVWRRHLRSLLLLQTEDGSWPYWPKRNARGYVTGTFMGLANLLLAERALREELDADDELRKRVDEARHRGLAALFRDGPPLVKGQSTGWSYYSLYALEKVCIFANRESLTGTLWYVRGAEWLLEMQSEDGGWGGPVGGRRKRSTLISSAFALLFLLRASETYHPVTPRPVDSGGTVTPGPEAEPPEPEAPVAPPPSPGRVEIGLARRLLGRLVEQLRENRVGNEELIASIRLVGTAHGSLRPDLDSEATPEEFAEAADRLRREIERALLVAVALRRERPGGDGENLRTDVNLHAMVRLAKADARVSPLLVRVLERSVFRHVADPDLHRFAFRALAAWNRPEALLWLAEEAVTADPREDRPTRTLAALEALRGFEEVPGAARREAAERVARTLAPLERSHFAAGREHWDLLRDDALETLRHLGRDAATGHRPTHRGRRISSVRVYLDWLREHDDPTKPPWAAQ